MTFEEWVATQTERPIGLKLAWEAAYKEGQKAMRERAAEECFNHLRYIDAHDCVESIRALQIEVGG